MSQTKKNKRGVQILTPWGRAGFCSVIRPNFKFKPEEGEFSCRLIFTPEEAAPLIAQLDELYEQAYADNLAAVQAEKPRVTEIKRADKPYKNVEDPDTGEKLPEFQVNARLKYKRIGKDENGKKVVFGTQRPIAVDAKKQPLRQEVGSGSTVRMSFLAGGFFTAALGSGLSLKLIGVQVKELVQVGLADPNFDEVDGFEETQVTAGDPVETIHAPEGQDTATADDESGDY